MHRPGVIPFIRAIRRSTTYHRLYGDDHRLTLEGCDEAADAGRVLTGDDGGVELSFAKETLFINGEPDGEVSLQFNGFLRAVEEVGVHAITLVGATDSDEVRNLIRLFTGDIDEFPDGPTIRVNDRDVITEDSDQSPAARFRRTYTQALDGLRGVGMSLREGAPIELDSTATAVRDLIKQGMEAPRASILLATVKSHHEYTFYHSVNTSILSLAAARLIGLSAKDQVLLGIGAMLHDIGKIGVSTAVLSHPGRLDEAQWAEIRRHPQIGAEAILAAAEPGQEVAATVAFEHHARFDGSGYPRLVYHDGTHHHGHGHGHPLHFFSRLVAVADTYDAITTRRSYRRAEPPSRAMQILVNEAGTSYDPDFVLAFTHLLGIHPPGSFLRLRGGSVVMVVGGDAEPGRVPRAVIVRDAQGAEVTNPEPVRYSFHDVVEHVPASVLGITPSSVLEKVSVG